MKSLLLLLVLGASTLMGAPKMKRSNVYKVPTEVITILNRITKDGK